MSDLFGNHIVGFPKRRLKCNSLVLHVNTLEIKMPATIMHQTAVEKRPIHEHVKTLLIANVANIRDFLHYNNYNYLITEVKIKRKSCSVKCIMRLAGCPVPVFIVDYSHGKTAYYGSSALIGHLLGNSCSRCR